jgi:hypothetical protein
MEKNPECLTRSILPSVLLDSDTLKGISFISFLFANGL